MSPPTSLTHRDRETQGRSPWRLEPHRVDGRLEAVTSQLPGWKAEPAMQRAKRPKAGSGTFLRPNCIPTLGSVGHSVSFFCFNWVSGHVEPPRRPQEAAGGYRWHWWQRTCLRPKRLRLDPWLEKIPWRREWQSTPVFLPGKSHGQRSLAGNSPWGHKESDVTEVT